MTKKEIKQMLQIWGKEVRIGAKTSPLHGIIKGIKPLEQKVLKQRYIYCYKWTDISKKLNMKLRTSYNYETRAIQKITKELGVTKCQG